MNITDSRTALEASRRRVLATVGDAGTILTQATGARMVAAWTLARGEDTSIVYAGLYSVLRRSEEVIGDLLTMEQELLAG